jgi:hypothetical protein
MPRPKGSGAIKFLDPKEQDTVEMRNRLWRGASAPSEAEQRLNRLCREQAELTVQLLKLRTQQTDLRAVINAEDVVTLESAKAERELDRIAANIKRVEKALGNTRKQIAEAWKLIHAPAARRETGVFEWQTRAVSLIELHKYLHKEKPGSVGADTVGSTITTHELQKQLRAEGFKVGARELRRFMRVCGVAGQQGKRTDL